MLAKSWHNLCLKERTCHEMVIDLFKIFSSILMWSRDMIFLRPYLNLSVIPKVAHPVRISVR